MTSLSPADHDPSSTPGEDDADAPVQEARRWRANGWTAQVIKNEDDDGWAVSMTQHGQSEPALVGPWTMGRDKKNPKPLDTSAFSTLVKTASEVLRRHEQQLQAQLHREIEVEAGPAGQRMRVTLDITPDEDNPSAELRAYDEGGDELGQARVSPGFRLTRTSAIAWIDSGYARPR